MEKVSIIIPTYNRANCIIDTIQNILNQSYKNIEIIIIDDGSEDNTKELIQQFKVKNNIENLLYYYKKNGGVSSARNFGIEKSSGKYIAFQDSDDLWDNDKLNKQISKLLETKKDICYCGTILRNKAKDKKIKNKFSSDIDLIYDILMSKSDAQTITWVIKKDLIEKYNIRFNEECSYSEDLEFFMKCIYVGSSCCVNEYLTYYINTEESLSNNIKNQFQEIYMWNRYKLWIENLKYRDNIKINKIIDNYRMPARIIFALYNLRKLRDDDYRLYYKKYISRAKKFNPLIGKYKKTLTFYLIILYFDRIK